MLATLGGLGLEPLAGPVQTMRLNALASPCPPQSSKASSLAGQSRI